MAYQVCRLCLAKGINLTALNTGENSLGERLSACMPEINIFIINNPLICTSCTNQLDMAYKFRVKCLLTEKQINMCVRNLYLKSIGYPRKVTEVPVSQLNENCTLPGSLSTYLNMSILEGLAGAPNDIEELAVAKKKIEASKDTQIKPCYVELIDCFERNGVNIIDKRLPDICDGKKRNALNELKIKELQSNKYEVEQKIPNCVDSKNMLNCTTSKRSYQKQINKVNANDKQMYLKRLRDEKTRQIKLTGAAESKQTNEMPRYEEKKVTENNLKNENDAVINENTCKPVIESQENENDAVINENICKPVTESQAIDSNRTQFQNGGNPTQIKNGCASKPENILRKESPKTIVETFNKDIPFKRRKTKATITRKKILNNVYAKVYKSRKRKLTDSDFEVKAKSVAYVQNQRETVSETERSKDFSFGNKIVNKSKMEHKMLRDFTTSVNCTKTQPYVNNLCHMCNIVINNVEIWKKHIRDHILSY